MRADTAPAIGDHTMQPIRGKRVTVAGLGRFGGGIAVSRWLVEQGAASVLVTDKASAEVLADSIKQLKGLPIDFRFKDQREEDFTQADLVVASPAIPPTNELLRAARSAGVLVTTEIRLFVERCPASVLAVTGTKGKSTTTAMLGEMLKSNFTTWVGGNIGKSLLENLPEIDKTHLVVLELSSFMLEHLGEMKWSPHVAAVTMISSDHLDWHGSHDAYVNAKRNIVRFQRADDFAVLNDENEIARSFAADTRGRILKFGTSGRRRFDLALSGEHNQLNAQAAYAAASIVGISWDQAQKAVRDFRGLPHRLQVVHEQDNVKFVNDSIATIPEAAIAALESFPAKRVIQIVGGSLKKNPPIVTLCAALCERAKAVLCIGESGPRIAETLANSPSLQCPPVYTCGDLATAVAEAKSIAVSGDIVLLSPGYASYDQFVNFEERGETFAKLAKSSS
jgi:UDP-N-acetylmuramoylalanine--D-glutamate ligase